MIPRTALILVLAGSLAMAAMAATAPLAVVVRAKGDVTSGAEKAMAPAKAGTLLAEGSRLKTGADGRALVRFLADQSIAEIKPGTLVDFSTRERGGGQGVARQIILRAGETAFRVIPGNGKDLRFETATTVASVRGTGFGMSTTAGGATRIIVEHGVVRVCNSLTGETRDLYPGEEIVSGWNGFESDTTDADDRGRASDTDSVATQRWEIDFSNPVTGDVKTLKIGSREVGR